MAIIETRGLRRTFRSRRGEADAAADIDAAVAAGAAGQLGRVIS